MRLRILLAFFLSIVIPTFLLAYFGLLSLRSEKSIVEKDLYEKYGAIADVIAVEIRSAIDRFGDGTEDSSRNVEDILLEEARLFEDEVVILDRRGRPIPGQAGVASGQMVLLRPIEGLPYSISVYERYPLLLTALEEKRRNIYLYMLAIIIAALSILIGGSLTLVALDREWYQARLKSEFVSHLSHDLRRPLTSICMFSEMLVEKRAPSDEKKQEYYTIIHNESEKLLQLANNILDFSRVESGRTKYKLQLVDIRKLVEETVDRFKSSMLGPRTVTLDVRETVFPQVKADPDAITQVLMNLLSNAVQYSAPDKDVRVCLFWEKRKVCIEVIDQGSGIARSEQKKIFRKFYRVSEDNTLPSEGSGLGLTLVKHIVDAHRGIVKVESREGIGTTFAVSLPV